MAIQERLESKEVAQNVLSELSAALARPGVTLSGKNGEMVTLPEPLRQLISAMLAHLGQGQTVILMPEKPYFTTQAAADALGVSRPFLIKLMEQGEIPCVFAGSHRRIHIDDLQRYREKRNQTRRSMLASLPNEANGTDLLNLNPNENADHGSR